MAHEPGCNCATCWEPKPRPGQTMDDVIREELVKEIALMDETHLGIMIEAVAAEQQRRHPLIGSESFSRESMGRADVKVVKEMVGIFSEAFNRRMEDKNKPPVDFVDVFMALINFDRLILQMIEEQSEFKTLEQKRSFRSVFVATVSQSLMRRLMN